MRKQYSKPEIMFESFTLCTNIAAGCAGIMVNPAEGSCAIPDGTGIYFLFNIDAADTQCNMNGNGSEEFNGFCYHNPENSSLFNS